MFNFSDSQYLIKQYKEQEFSYNQLKYIVKTLKDSINDILEEGKILNPENSDLLTIYENIISHLTIFSLLNEVYLHKSNQAEEDYNYLKREIKTLTDIIKKQKTNLEKISAEESKKKELSDIKRKINAFRSTGLQQDIIYETINL